MKALFQALAEDSEQILLPNFQADGDVRFQTVRTVKPQMLVIIDAGVADYKSLAMGVVDGAIALVLDPNRDGVEQITEALHCYSPITRLHLISHGSPSCIYLGNSQLSLLTIADYAPLLQRWSSYLKSQILIYGCDVAAGDAGREFIEQLQQLTGVAIAASTTRIGSATQGGSWRFDITTDRGDVSPCFQDEVMRAYPAAFAAGDLDTSFGNNGIVAGLAGAGAGLGLQPDGKLLVTSTIPGSSSSFTLSRYNSNGSLDTSFGSSGRVTGFNNSGEDILIQPDGKIIVAGDTPATIPSYPSGATSFSVTRYNIDGSLDTGFGTNGTTVNHVGTVHNDQLSAVLQPDGKILLGGYSFYTGSDSQGLLVRYNSNGSLDSSFGNSALPGVSTALITNEQSYGFSVALQSDGQIILAGASTVNPQISPSLALWKFSPTGSLIGSTKTAFTSLTNYQVFAPSNIPQVAVQADGKIVVAEDMLYNQPYQSPIRYSFARFNSDLTLDTSFGTGGGAGGYFQGSSFPSSDIALNYNSLALQPDGKIVTAGRRDQNGVGSFIVERHGSNGALDSSFGAGGGVLTNFGNGNASASNLVIQPDGKVVATGTANGSFTLVRYVGVSSGVNQAPTDISLSNTNLFPFQIPQPGAFLIGNFSTVDPDVSDRHSYRLVSGVGDTDNGLFLIQGGNGFYLAPNTSTTQKQTYSIRVRSDDGRDGTFEKSIILSTGNLAPVASTPIGDKAVTIGSLFSLSVATTFTDPNPGDTFTLNASLSNGNPLPSWLSFNPATGLFSGTPSSSDAGTQLILLRATDRAGAFSTTNFNLTVNGTVSNQAPTNLSLSSTSIAENLPANSVVGTFTTTDPNPGDTFTYSLVAGIGSTHNAAFKIVGNTLRTTQAFDFEAQSTYSVRVRTDDGKGGVLERVLAVNVQDGNDAPIVATPLTNRTATVSKAFRYVVPTNTFFDQDVAANSDLDWLTLSATLSDSRPLPSWLRFNANTGTFSGTPKSGHVGNLNIVVKATDVLGASVSSSFILSVQ